MPLVPRPQVPPLHQMQQPPWWIPWPPSSLPGPLPRHQAMAPLLQMSVAPLVPLVLQPWPQVDLAANQQTHQANRRPGKHTHTDTHRHTHTRETAPTQKCSDRVVPKHVAPNSNKKGVGGAGDMARGQDSCRTVGTGAGEGRDVSSSVSTCTAGARAIRSPGGQHTNMQATATEGTKAQLPFGWYDLPPNVQKNTAHSHALQPCQGPAQLAAPCITHKNTQCMVVCGRHPLANCKPLTRCKG